MKNVDDFLAQLPEPQQMLAGKLRSLIKETAPHLAESLKWGMPCYANGKNICYLAVQKNYLNLGFYDASALNDPEKLLEGTGKKMRHVKVRSLESLPENALRNLIKEAAV